MRGVGAKKIKSAAEITGGGRQRGECKSLKMQHGRTENGGKESERYDAGHD